MVSREIVEASVLGVHMLILLLLALVIFFADYQALQWFRGTAPTLNSQRIKRLHRYVHIGLGVMILTGLGLFSFSHDKLVVRPVFWLKMVFVLTLIINSIFVGRLMHIATVRTFVSLTRNEKILVLAAGAFSIVGWLGAAFCAFFILPK